MTLSWLKTVFRSSKNNFAVFLTLKNYRISVLFIFRSKQYIALDMVLKVRQSSVTAWIVHMPLTRMSTKRLSRSEDEFGAGKVVVSAPCVDGAGNDHLTPLEASWPPRIRVGTRVLHSKPLAAYSLNASDSTFLKRWITFSCTKTNSALRKSQSESVYLTDEAHKKKL